MVGCIIKTTINGKLILRTPYELLFMFREVSKWNYHLDKVLSRLLYVTPKFRYRQFYEQFFSTVSWKTVFWSTHAHMTSRDYTLSWKSVQIDDDFLPYRLLLMKIQLMFHFRSLQFSGLFFFLVCFPFFFSLFSVNF